MTTPHHSDGPTNRDEFGTQLRQLVRSARDNEVAVRGAYDVRSPKPDERDFQIEVTEVAKKPHPERFPTD